MLKFVIQKMLNKKWMVLALLVGNILMISIAASNPMYTEAVLQRTLESDISNYMTARNRYPMTMVVRTTGLGKDDEAQQVITQVLEKSGDTIGLPVKTEAIYQVASISSETASSLERDDRRISLSIGTLSGIEDHVEMVAGSMYTPGGNEDGVIEAVVSEKGFQYMQNILGEEISFRKFTQENGERYKLKIVGVFKNSSSDDPYWVQTPNSYSAVLLVDGQDFHKIFRESGTDFSISSSWFLTYDYSDLKVRDVENVIAKTQQVEKECSAVSGISTTCYYEDILNNFMKTAKKVRTTFLVLQVPIFVLLAAFIFMVSKQMLEMEENEIAVLKSRGAGSGQVIGVYLIQSLVLAVLSYVIGVVLAFYLVRVLGAANAFLEFVSRKALKVEMSSDALIYGAAAAVFSIATMVIPVFRHSKTTIVNHKQKKHRASDRPFWQKCFLDIIILGVSIYGLYNFNNQKELLAQRVLEGESLDPLLFISSSLFMLGAGLFALRIIPWIIRLIFALFKNKWSPALYTSFVRVLRTRKQQGFIMVFLVMTIAIGVFDASAARTINNNDEKNVRYMAGADITLQEKWKDNSAALEDNPDLELQYTEPDYDRYAQLEDAESVTKVLVNKTGSVSITGGGNIRNVTIMGINTKEFGETAYFDHSLLKNHNSFEYLNAMSQKANAVLVSTNFRDKYGYKLSDIIYFKTSTGKLSYGIIYGFVDYWPGYAQTIYKKGSDGLYTDMDNYLIVANLAMLQSVWGVTPYQIWIRTKDSSRFIYDFMAESGKEYLSFTDTAASLVAHKNDAVMQGTNGILTVGFIVVLVLCTVGFLIYWILSIRSRELQFGIFRAMGMSMREIITMLINEHIFISGTAIAAGALVGALTAKLFMPLIQIAYSSSDNAIPLTVVSQTADHVRLGIIVGAMILLCLIILAVIIRKMKIAQALKLGED